jgi:hypothetical protein
MSHGPGKYDYECTLVRAITDATGVAVIVIGGNRGGGFSVQCADPVLLGRLPEMLESMAKDIRTDLEKGKS